MKALKELPAGVSPRSAGTGLGWTGLVRAFAGSGAPAWLVEPGDLPCTVAAKIAATRLGNAARRAGLPVGALSRRGAVYLYRTAP
jgi:hypothetical protein